METEKQTKACSRCGRELPVSEFNKCSSNKDGLQAQCRECQHHTSKQSYEKRKALKRDEATTNDDVNALSAFKPRELIEELRRRGYKGKLTYTHVIEL